VLAQRRQILDSFRNLKTDGLRAQSIRVHGDYHLGCVLQVRTDYVIVNFRESAKESPLKDVAHMLRSMFYAAYASLIGYTTRRPEDFEKLEPWARLWERSTCAEFLRAYRETAGPADFLPADEAGLRRLLGAYWLNRVLSELTHELDDRPAWVRIPLLGILAHPIDVGGLEWNSLPFPSRR